MIRFTRSRVTALVLSLERQLSPEPRREAA